MGQLSAAPPPPRKSATLPMIISFVFVLWTLCILSVGADFPSSRTANRQRKPPPHQSSRKPNIVLILTDDQDVELGSLNFMPKTLRAIRDQGAEFRHAYVTTPMCCPSRSSLLTGMYVHNHNVYTNNDNCSSTQWQTTYERKSFATYLNNAGYRTGYFGKYLNKYNGSYVPPGWREWGGLIMNSKYYNYSINMNGKKIKHGFDYYKDYYPDLIANDSIAFLRQSKKNSAHKPVMLTMSFPAPHGPEDSAPQYSHLFFNVTTHHTPSYDYAPNPDKQWILRVTNNMLPIHKQFTDLLMTKRLQTLQSVDAAVQLVVDELERLGELDNTYIIYTSDHGYHLGQFGLIKGKSFPFEFDVRVPFLVRGPGVEPGTVVQDIVLNIDLAPTFLHIAGVEAPAHMDGRSVLPLFLNAKRKRPRWPDTFLIESSGRRETPYLDARSKANRLANRKNASTESPMTTMRILSTSTTQPTTTTTTTTVKTTTAARKLYESGEELDSFDDDDDDENEGEDEEDDEFGEELDDGIDDEFNFNDDTNSTNKILIKDNELLTDNRDLPIVNKLERLAIECTQSDMGTPCRVQQKWYCINDNGRWRKHKCKHSPQQQPPIFNKTYKKCACFTPTGLIYKKIPLPHITRRHTADRDMKRILFRGEGLENPGRISRRHKRETLANVESAMRDVQGKIYGLKNKLMNGTLPDDRTTNTISDTIADCVVMPRGEVNCSTTVYQDKKTWRKSRHRIDNEIYQARQKLEQLKEIRRYLINIRPNIEQEIDMHRENTNNTNKTELRENNELSEAEMIDLHENVYENTTSRTAKRKRKRPQRTDTKTTTAPPTLTQANPHRHHKYISTTDAPSTWAESSPASVSTSPTKRRFVTTAATTPKVDDLLPYDNHYCHCDTEDDFEKHENRLKDEKRRLKEEKLRRKLRKQRKRDQQEKACSSERMNCFYHDKEHWKTAPMWTEDDFCFCMNANNNTYSCVRTINSTDNFLYCEFTTGLVTYYNLRIDPFELHNRIEQLTEEKKNFLHNQLRDLIACKGKSCTVGDNHHHHHHQSTTKPRDNLLPFHPISSPQQRYRKRKPVSDGHGVDETLGRSPGVKTNYRNRNITMAKMNILRETGNRRRRRKS